jgi:hypothetical protein
MPIEIKELHIKAAVTYKKNGLAVTSLTADDLLKLKKEIISEVTENVFQVLRQKNER